MFIGERLHDLRRRLRGVDPLRRLDERGVVPGELRLPFREQLRERELDALVVLHLREEVRGADRVTPFRAGQEILLEPRGEVPGRRDDAAVGVVEFLLECRVGSRGLLRPGRDGAREVADRSLRHADGEVRELLRRVDEVRLRGVVERRHEPQPRDQRPQPLGGRREAALDQAVCGASGQARVAHRVSLPGADRVLVEQKTSDLAFQRLCIDGVVERELRAVHRLQAREERPQLDDPGLDAPPRAVFEFRVVLMETGVGALGREVPEPRVEIVVDELREGIGGRRRAPRDRLCRRRARDREGADDDPRNHGLHAAKASTEGSSRAQRARPR